MLLIKEFNDYYDFGVGFGVDKKIVYNRKRESYDLFNPQTHTPKYILDIYAHVKKLDKHDWKTPKALSLRTVIGFCGVIYSVPRIVDVGKPTIHVWQASDIPDKLGQGQLYDWASRISKKMTLAEWALKNDPVITYEAMDFFLKNQLVCFAVSGNKVIINPNLSEYGLQKRLPGIDAFQVLSMHLSRLSTKEQAHNSISDKDLRDAKGFDDMSFRHR